MDSVPVQTSGPAPTGRGSVERPVHHKRRNKLKKLSPKFVGGIVGIIVVAAMLAFGVWFLYRSSTGANIDSSKYQAVFFTNGQVYFGKLQTLNGSYMKLTDIFYLQTKTDADASSNPQSTTSATSSDVELIKLGQEIHGPDDEMVISRDQILFFENLKKDGKVSDTILNYVNNKR